MMRWARGALGLVRWWRLGPAMVGSALEGGAACRNTGGMEKWHHVFVYGTLKPGGSNSSLWKSSVQVDVRSATMDGLALYQPVGGRFPYATPTPDLIARGAVITFPERTGLFKVLDDLEGYDPQDPDGSHYVRTTATVRVGEEAVPSWVYVAGPSVNLGAMDPVANGDWSHRVTPVGPR